MLISVAAHQPCLQASRLLVLIWRTGLVVLQAAADAAIQAAISSFTAAHTADPPLVEFFDLAGLQRSFKKQALALGFIDTVNGWCAPAAASCRECPSACMSQILSDRYSPSLELPFGDQCHNRHHSTHARPSAVTLTPCIVTSPCTPGPMLLCDRYWSG